MRRKKEEKARKIYEKYKKEINNLSKEAFFVAGLMLYLGEGDKKNYSRVGLVNTDHRVIKFFIKWMTQFFDVPKSKMKAYLSLYNNMDIEKEKNFWRRELGFKDSQFYKPNIRELKKSSFSYSGSYRHGTCGIHIGSVEKKMEVMMAIQAFVDKYLNE